MGKYQRRKGHNYERYIASAMRTVYEDEQVRRGHQTHRAIEADVIVDQGVYGRRLWIECKKGKRPNIHAAFKQAIEESSKDGARERPEHGNWIHLAATKKDREEDLVTLRLGDFLELLRAAERL